MGVSEIIGINSTGSLKRGLAPGSIVVPDDFISISVTPTIFSDRASHVVPSLSDKVREGLIAAASDCNIYVVGKGTYWQTTGPRLETKAEIRFMSKFADIVGMTMASEAILANEFGLPYASLCSVDNYGNGLTKVPLSEHDIKEGNRTNVRTAVKIITRYIERGHTYEVFKKRR
jgi:5'-methylthioadenosine phosphorylase